MRCSFLHNTEETFSYCSQHTVTALEEVTASEQERCPPTSEICHQFRVRWQAVLNPGMFGRPVPSCLNSHEIRYAADPGAPLRPNQLQPESHSIEITGQCVFAFSHEDPYLISQIVSDGTQTVPKGLESPRRSKANSVSTELLPLESSMPMRWSVEGSSLAHMSSSTLDSEICAESMDDELSEMGTMPHSQLETVNTSPRSEDTAERASWVRPPTDAESIGADSNLHTDSSDDFGELLSFCDSLTTREDWKAF